MKKLFFNTGRTYSDKGQRIGAALLDDGRIVMVDIDRYIDATLPANVNFTPVAILKSYDLGEMDYRVEDYDLKTELQAAAENTPLPAFPIIY